MNITILGAAGKTGIRAVDYALSQGHSVTALVRSAGKLTERKGLTVVIGDATNPSDVMRASKGADAIVSTLGNTKGGLMVPAIQAVIASAKKSGVKRFMLMSSVLSRRDQLSGFQSFISNKLMKKMVEDKLESEEMLSASSLDWTIVYAGMLHNKENDKKVVDMGVKAQISPKNKISRAHVAQWMVDNAASTDAQNIVVLAEQ